MAYIIAGWSVFVLLIWIPVEYAHAAFCFNNYDLGIYGQALTLLSLKNLNPYLSTRDIRLFNDHFDPILFLVAPLKAVVEPSLLAIRIEMSSIVLASLAPIWLWLNRLISKFQMSAVFFVILFSPMTLMAAFYPSHPGTWALAPLAWLLASIYARKDRLAITMLLLLLLCKEEFPILGGLLGVVLILQKRQRLGFWISTISVAWSFAVFFLRPIFLGKSDYYTSAMMAAHGVTGVGTGTWLFPLLELLFCIFMPLLILRANKNFGFNRLKRDSWLMVCLPLVFLLLAIRIVGGYWGNHRAAPLAVLAAFMLMGTNDHMSKYRRTRRLLFFAVLLALVVPFLELGSRTWRDRPFKKHCPSSPERIDALNAVVNYLGVVGAESVLAGGNIVPHLVRIPGIAQIGATKADNFRFFVVEKGEYRNTWPISAGEMKQIEDDWRKRPGVSVLRDDQHVLLIENSSE
jgi:uncharacterized membrane protein